MKPERSFLRLRKIIRLGFAIHNPVAYSIRLVIIIWLPFAGKHDIIERRTQTRRWLS